MKTLTIDTYRGDRYHAECFDAAESWALRNADAYYHASPGRADACWGSRKRGRCRGCRRSTALPPRQKDIIEKWGDPA